ncbi:MAG: CRISPR-associated helicase Cas3' [Blastocatellia bacterium]|nr:CRISPR-associated helicase Cas3' [Blastocatellia bacterium]
MQSRDKLLAKSRYGNRELSLEEHLCDTERAAQLIFRLNGRWGQNWCRFFKLSDADAQTRFLLNLRVAALFHDIGKANEDFYRAVTEEKGFVTQTLRHEHLSALLLCLPEVREWLAQNSLLDSDVITAAVLSHHLKAAESGEEYKARGWKWCHPRGRNNFVQLYLQHPEVSAVVERIATVASLKGVPGFNFSHWAPTANWVQAAWQNGSKAAKTFARSIRHDKHRLALLLAVKAGVIVADSAASGLFRENHKLEEWIDDVVHSHAISGEDVANAILKPRTEQISKNRGTTFSLRPFQEKTAEQGSRALLLAACAAGKTIAAWKWAEAQAKNCQIGRVIFLYPTRGTATEGFRDYVGWAPETEGALVHGTSPYELEAMRANPSEAIAEKNYDKLNEDHARLFALGLWSRRYFSATVDQFLGFIEHNYTGLCLLPALADSAVIIDEVHSFDQRMFDCLIAFLKNFEVPVLCMTATLPPSRVRQLEAAGLKLYQASEDAELHKLESHPRYRLESVTGADAALAEAIAAYRRGQRVLWVVNRVAECQRIAGLLESALGIEIITYHSRFRLRDRKDVHANTVKAFQQKSTPAIAVTTQVCEMSLDLDADVLITEVAPISSLVQRFGRANRHLEKGLEFRARLLTYPPEKALPYTKEELVAATTFLAEFGTNDVSQRQLAESLTLHAIDESQSDGSARFLESGYFAVRGDFRDTDEFAIPCILTTDLDEVKKCITARQPLDGFIVNVPKSYVLKVEDTERPARLPKYLGLANGDLYCRRRGFLTE